MQLLHYTGDTLLTTDDVANALMAYASALADSHTSDVVVVPILDQRGDVVMAEMLLGPASQLYSTPADGAGAEVEVDEAVVQDLRLRARRLRHPEASPDRGEQWLVPDTDLD
ncbi:hypothetical protein [Microbacterium sp. Marseille-Q6648]|uniref:hypothetical protein n=1 Tax=Microbacterium sp. Marseille-Q6648 TaxID=2937991 RepID=UPI0020420306|nr:hypothetical protein [Microbacterium sp. Marseille-Q6648]